SDRAEGSRAAGPRSQGVAQRSATLAPRPEVIRHHRHTCREVSIQCSAGLRPRDPEDLPYAWNPSRLRVVELRDGAIEVRATRDHGRQGTGNYRVDPVSRCTGHDL